MQYTAYAYKDGELCCAEFPDAPGCSTFAPTKRGLRFGAKEALLGWLEVTILEDEPLALPKHRLRPPRKSGWLVSIELPARYARAVKAHVERLAFRLAVNAPSEGQLKLQRQSKRLAELQHR